MHSGQCTPQLYRFKLRAELWEVEMCEGLVLLQAGVGVGVGGGRGEGAGSSL